ncbi:hypothetical protein JCM8097_008352 [Rhodosporidiobolus ruineniae]
MAQIPDTPELVEEASQQPPAWTKQYDALAARLPPKLASLVPSSSTANSAINTTSDRLKTFGSTVGSTATSQWAVVSSKSAEAGKDISTFSAAQWKKAGPEAWCACAWVVVNETQVPLNVSLNQVGPLYFEVLKPEETFERRVPNLPFSLEIRPFDGSNAYGSWDKTWPILAVTGPAVALTSLLAIPLVAFAAGGTALASLTSFGSSVAAGTAAVGDAAMATAGTATALVAKASSLPGARQVKGKLADAARKAVGENISREKVQRHVVRYLTTRGGAAAAEGAAGGAELEAAAQRQITAEEEDRRKQARKQGKVDEVEVTGLDVEKVLRCQTGKSSVDKALAKAFKRLSIKSKLREYTTSENPVLRIVGGPELETRTPPSSFLHPHPAPKTYIVFYPFTILHAPPSLVRAEPVPVDEEPPTADEARVMQQGRVVEKWETAEKAVEKAPSLAEGNEGGAGLDKAVEEAERETGEKQEEEAVEAGKGKGKEGEGEPQKKKGWFW